MGDKFRTEKVEVSDIVAIGATVGHIMTVGSNGTVAWEEPAHATIEVSGSGLSGVGSSEDPVVLSASLQALSGRLTVETSGAGQSLAFYEGTAGGTNTITLRAPSTIGTSRVITLADSGDVDLDDLFNATSSNTASCLVKRDSNGDFSAGVITASLIGHASLDILASTIGEANGVASLNASSYVIQNPANATATAGASKIPISGSGGNLAKEWLATGTASSGYVPVYNGSDVVWGYPASTVTRIMTFTPVSITTNGQAISETNYGYNWFVNKGGSSSTVSIDGSGRLAVVYASGSGEDWYSASVAAPGLYVTIPPEVMPRFPGHVLNVYYTSTMSNEAAYSSGDFCRIGACFRGNALSSTGINWYGCFLEANATNRFVVTIGTNGSTSATVSFTNLDSTFFTTGTQHKLQLRADGRILAWYRKVGTSAWTSLGSTINSVANNVLITTVYFIIANGGTVASGTALLSSISMELTIE